MDDCIVCVLKEVYFLHFPISYRCFHEIGQERSDIAIKSGSFMCHCVICIVMSISLLCYIKLFRDNCQTPTLACMMLTSDFLLTAAGYLNLFFKLIKFGTIVTALKSWLSLHENRFLFGVRYLSLAKQRNSLKKYRTIYNISLYMMVAFVLCINGFLVQHADFKYIRIFLQTTSIYFQMQTVYECAQTMSFMFFMFQNYSIFLKNNLLLALPSVDRLVNYKRIVLAYDYTTSKQSLEQKFRKLNRFFLAYCRSVDLINAIYFPLVLVWFAVLTSNLISNIYVIVNADDKNYQIMINVLKIILFNTISIIIYLLALAENLNNMVSVSNAIFTRYNRNLQITFFGIF